MKIEKLPIMQAVLGSILIAGMAISLTLLARDLLRLVAENKKLIDQHESLRREYFKDLERLHNIDLIYSTFFKDTLQKSENQNELIEYFRSEMELIYKRSTIGEKEDNHDLYTEQERLDAQTCGIIRQIVRPLMPEIDELASKYYEKYVSTGSSGE